MDHMRTTNVAVRSLKLLSTQMRAHTPSDDGIYMHIPLKPPAVVDAYSVTAL